MEKAVRRKYTDEFREGAVKLVTDQECKISEAARNLGIYTTQLHRWIKGTYVGWELFSVSVPTGSGLPHTRGGGATSPLNANSLNVLFQLRRNTIGTPAVFPPER